jgi:hypothetical protein
MDRIDETEVEKGVVMLQSFVTAEKLALISGTSLS